MHSVTFNTAKNTSLHASFFYTVILREQRIIVVVMSTYLHTLTHTYTRLAASRLLRHEMQTSKYPLLRMTA